MNIIIGSKVEWAVMFTDFAERSDVLQNKFVDFFLRNLLFEIIIV